MKEMGSLGQFLCADGKFFKIIGKDERTGQDIYRQIELYLPSADGTYKQKLWHTLEEWLCELHTGSRVPKWAIGSTGGQLTARYMFRNDGELMSILALNGGM